MHFSRFILAACLLAAAPALAQQSGRPTFGSYTCASPVPCAGSAQAAATSTAEWAAYGNSCVSGSFGYNNANGFFDQNTGLDTAACLTALPGALPKGMGSQLAPRCCVVILPNNACAMHCDIVME